MGVETEFGILGGWTYDKARSIHAEVMKRPHLPAAISYGGGFLTNGARVYVDQESQNEYCTPETRNPSDLIARELAGRHLMQQMASRVGQSLLCSNLDYASRNTWGTHENYECPTPLSSTAHAILFTHLVTRIIYTGAGGLDPAFPGVRPILSPRASVIVTPMGHQGWLAKALVFVKPQNYGSGHRLHVFCGESLLSHVANYLKYGTTALVTILLSQGEHIGPGPFAMPVLRELKRLNRDTSLSARFKMQCGGYLTAIEIQEQILADVTALRDKLPDWAPLVILRWRNILENLRSPASGESPNVDWVVFYNCLTQLAGEYGLGMEEVAKLNKRVESNGSAKRTKISPELSALRNAACELYLRLHVVGDNPLFRAVEDAGHRLPEITDERIADAVENPPPNRAANRADFVKKYHASGQYRVSWDRIVDYSNHGFVEIPNETQADWEKEPLVRLAQSSFSSAQAGCEAFRHGSYHKALRYFKKLDPRDLDPTSLDSYVLSLARLGMRKQTLEMLELLKDHYSPLAFLAEQLFCRINFGLTPPLQEMELLIDKGDAMIREGSANCFVFQQNKARFLTLAGRYVEAEALFQEMLSTEAYAALPRMFSRTECYYAELLRRRGETEKALSFAAKAMSRQEEHSLTGDLAEHCLPLFVKMLPDSEVTLHMDRAVLTLMAHENHLGQIRLLCLRSRRFGETEHKDTFRELRGKHPILKTCPTAIRIANNWNEWTHPDRSGRSIDYWGL